MGLVQYTPRAYAKGDDVTVAAKSAILAGHLVVIDSTSSSGALVGAHAGASAPSVLGVAWADAAVGAQVAIACTGIVRVVAGATVTAGTAVASGAAGVVVPAGANPAVGYAVTGGASGDLVEIQL